MVAEAAVANVFVFRKGALLTPPATDGALEGITRGSVLELAAGLGIPAREQSLSRMDLISADEMFLTGAGARVVGVRSLDGTADRRARAGSGHREARRGVQHRGASRRPGVPELSSSLSVLTSGSNPNCKYNEIAANRSVCV